MKKFVSILVLSALSLCAFAQGNIPLLDKAQGHRVTFHYTYSLSQKGEDFGQCIYPAGPWNGSVQ